MSIKYAKASSYHQLCPYCRDVVLYHHDDNAACTDERGRSRIAHGRCHRRAMWKAKRDEKHRGARAAGLDFHDVPKLVLPPREPSPLTSGFPVPPGLESVAHMIRRTSASTVFPNISIVDDGFQVKVGPVSKYFAASRFGTWKDAYVAAYLWRHAARDLHERGCTREEILRRLTVAPPHTREELREQQKGEMMATLRKIVQQLWDTLDVEEEARNERRRLLSEIADVIGLELSSAPAPTPPAPTPPAHANGNGNGNGNGHAKIVLGYGSRTKVDPRALVAAMGERFTWDDLRHAAHGAGDQAVRGAITSALEAGLAERTGRGRYRKPEHHA